MPRSLLTLLALLASTSCGQPDNTVTLIHAPPSGTVVTIQNGPHFTTAGQRVEAHSGPIMRYEGAYWLYGETYTCGFRWLDPSTHWCGLRVYRSSDLIHWTGPKLLFDPSPWQRICMHSVRAPGFGCWAPRVAWNATTQRYVLWIELPPEAGESYRTLTSTAPDGPFVESPGLPQLADSGISGWPSPEQGTLNGDEGLFVDSGGTGWLAWNRVGTVLVERLDPTYTTGAGQPILVQGIPDIPPHGAEAPSMFVHGARYYLSLSLPRCAYCTRTGAGIASAPGPAGPWTYDGKISETSCNGQPNGVSELADGTLLFSSDLWLDGPAQGTWPRLNETAAEQEWEPLRFDGDRVLPLVCPRSFDLRI